MLDNEKMRRWVLKPGAKSTDGLTLEHAEIPVPQAGQVRVKIKAVSLNYRDQIVLNETFTPITQDVIPLADGAGIIDAVGDDVTNWNIGDKVVTFYPPEEWRDGPAISNMGFGLGSEGTDGVLAEYVILSARQITAAPKTLSMEEAASLPCAALTAWTALYGDRPYKRHIGKDTKVLALGTGSVSLFALSLAKAAGAEIYGTSSSNDKINKIKSLGVKEAVNYSSEKNWGEVVYKKTGGVDLVINAVGGSAMEQSLTAVGQGGEVAFVGLIDFEDKPINYFSLMSKAATIRGVATGSFAAYLDLINFIDEHQLKPTIDKVFNFEDAKDAYQAAISKELFGKVVIKVGE